MSEIGKVPLKKIVEAMEEVNDVWALLYMYITRPIINGGYGKKGEVAIREGVRNFGAFRGKEIRKWHEAEGLPINVETLNRFWDAAFLWVDKDAKNEAKFSPYHVTYPVRKCTISEIWKEENYEQYGYWYCDENHESII